MQDLAEDIANAVRALPAERQAQVRDFVEFLRRRDQSHGESAPPADDPLEGILGIFSDEPELADYIVEDAMKARESDPLRTDNE